MNEYEKVEKTYWKMIELEPDYAEYRAEFGEFLLKVSKYAAASEQFQECINIDPDYGQSIYIQCGKCWSHLLNDKDSKNVNKLSSNDLHFHLCYGAYFAFELRDTEEAMFHFETAIGLIPIDVDYGNMFGRLLKRFGDDCQHIMEYEKDEWCYSKAIELSSNDGDCHLRYAEFLAFCLKDVEKTKFHLDKAILIGFDQRRFHRSDRESKRRTFERIAEMFRDIVYDYMESEKYYLKALEIDKRRFDYASYGYLLYLMGDKEKARKNFDIVLKRGMVEHFTVRFVYLLD